MKKEIVCDTNVWYALHEFHDINKILNEFNLVATFITLKGLVFTDKMRIDFIKVKQA